MQTLKHLLLTIIIPGICFCTANPAIAQWSQTTAPILYWYSIASSADGSQLLAAPDGAQLYSSTNSGSTWLPKNSPNAAWTGVASSADGTKLYGIGEVLDSSFNVDYNVYFSPDSGNTWNLTTSSTTLPWWKVACSADGTRAVAVCNYGPVFTTSDSGSNWVQATDLTSTGFWEGCASSADGRVMAAVSFAQPTGYVAISTNYGVNWSVNNNAPQNRYWMDIACSASGKQMVAVADTGPYQAATIFTSLDWGNTWSSDNDAPTNSWDAVACSADGKRMVAGSGNGYEYQQIYVSTNSGTNWVLTDAPTADWAGVACSTDGGKMYAVVGEHNITGPIYQAHVVVAPKLKITPAANGAAISWTVPSTNFVLQQSSSLIAPNWTTVTNAPTVTNVKEQVIVPSTNPQSFFQLQSE